MRKAINAVIMIKNRLLLFKKDLVWILPGGKPREGESDVEALARKFKEEASGAELIVKNYYGSFMGKTPHTGDSLEAVTYLAKLKKSRLKITPSGEISEVRFAGYFDVFTLKLSDITEKVVSCLVEGKYF